MKAMLNRLAVATSVLVLGETSARAISVGDNMMVNYRYPAINTVIGTGQSFTVALGGTTFSHTFSGLSFDISVAGDTITISRFQSGSNPDGTTQGFSGPPGSPNGATDAGVTFNGLVFTDFSTAFSGFTLTSVTALPSFDASRIGISGKDLSLNFMGLFFTTGQSEVVLQAQTASSVPEGGNTLLLLGASGVSLLAGRFKFCGKISHGTA